MVQFISNCCHSVPLVPAFMQINSLQRLNCPLNVNIISFPIEVRIQIILTKYYISSKSKYIIRKPFPIGITCRCNLIACILPLNLSQINYMHNVNHLSFIPQIIYLAGDNDIGGEGNDPITPQKIARFEKHFSSVTEAVQYKHVAFHKVSLKTNGRTLI